MADTAEELDLPRKQVGPNPQHLLITLIGDFWHGRAVAVPSSALVDLLGEFGITPASARSALSRLARRGILMLHRDGRSTSYSVREEFLRAGEMRASRNLRLGDDTDPAPWNGRWVIVMSGPEGGRESRAALRSHLRGAALRRSRRGCGPPYRRTRAQCAAAWRSWISPGVMAFSAETAPSRRSVGGSTGSSSGPSKGVGEQYQDFIEDYAPYLDPVARGSLRPARRSWCVRA